MARRGAARPGKARRGQARQGTVYFQAANSAWRGAVWQGLARPGEARQGKVFHKGFQVDELNELEIRYFPLDFDALKKGDTIPPDRLEQLTGCERGTSKYQLAVLTLRERIVKECHERGREFTVAIIKGALRILTDSEASLYNARAFKGKFRGAGRALKRAARVDTSNLDDGQKKEHERNLIVFGKMLQAARSARAAIAATPHQRTTPGLPAPSCDSSGPDSGSVKDNVT